MKKGRKPKIGRMLLFVVQCHRSSSTEKGLKGIAWPQVIKDMEIAWSANQPDSVRYREIKSIFDKHGVTLPEYRLFYREYVNKNLGKNIKLLKAVENLLIEDLKKTAESTGGVEDKHRPVKTDQ